MESDHSIQVERYSIDISHSDSDTNHEEEFSSKKSLQKQNSTSSNNSEDETPPYLTPARRTSSYIASGDIVVKEGTLWKRSKGWIRTTWNERYFVLVGGSLYYYSKIRQHIPHKGVFHLQNTIITEPPPKIKRKFVIVIQNLLTKKNEIILASTNKEDLEEWKSALKIASLKKPCGPPDILTIEKKKKGMSELQNKLFEAAINWGPTKKVVVNFLSDEAIIILESLKSFITKYDSIEKANELEKYVLSIGVKVILLFKGKVLSNVQLNKLKGPIHRLCDKVIDGYEIPFAFTPKELIDAMIFVKNVLLEILSPHLSEKTINKFKKLTDYLIREEIVADFFQKKKWKECAEIGEVLRKWWDAGEI